MAFRGILPRPESTGERFVKEFSNTAQTLHGLGSQLKQEKKEKLEREEDLARRKIEREEDFAHSFKLQEARQKADKVEEKRRGYEIGLGSIQAMKELIPNLGTSNALMSYIPGTDASAAVQKYETYANSLLGILSTIPVRNQKEFEAVKESISSPRSSQEQIRAGIEAAEDIITRHMESLGKGKSEEGSSQEQQKDKKVKFNPSNPEHLAKMKQLEKTHKGDKAKVNRDLAREFE